MGVFGSVPPVLHLLIVTSPWLDLAKRRDRQEWIVPIRVLHFPKRLELLMPQLVLDEYGRNRAGPHCGRTGLP